MSFCCFLSFILLSLSPPFIFFLIRALLLFSFLVSPRILSSVLSILIHSFLPILIPSSLLLSLCHFFFTVILVLLVFLLYPSLYFLYIYPLAPPLAPSRFLSVFRQSPVFCVGASLDSSHCCPQPQLTVFPFTVSPHFRCNIASIFPLYSLSHYHSFPFASSLIT